MSTELGYHLPVSSDHLPACSYDSQKCDLRPQMIDSPERIYPRQSMSLKQSVEIISPPHEFKFSCYPLGGLP